MAGQLRIFADSIWYQGFYYKQRAPFQLTEWRSLLAQLAIKPC